VALARLRVEADVIAQAGTSAALHPETQAALLGRNALFGHGATDFRDRLFGDRDAFGGGLRGFRCGCHCLRFFRPIGRYFLFLSLFSLVLPTTYAAGCIVSPALRPEPRRLSIEQSRATSQFGARGYFASAATGLGVSCFFFQSPIAARMASSASTE